MAGDRKRMSKVFVGHPWNEKPGSGKFPQEEFRRILYELPIIPDFGNVTPRAGTLGTLLNHLKSQMGKAEYCLFDLTDLNPNVTFELGINMETRAEAERVAEKASKASGCLCTE